VNVARASVESVFCCVSEGLLTGSLYVDSQKL
jgi:hypothetical protein